MRHVYAFIAAIFAAGLFTGIAGPLTAHAMPEGLSISPLRTELTLIPGMPHTGTVTVANTTQKDMNIDMSAEEFSVKDNNYDYVFRQNTAITKRISFTPQPLLLRPGESQKVNYTITLPENMPAKGVYVGVFAGTEKQSANKGIIAYERVASLLYISPQTAKSPTRTGELLLFQSPWLLSGDASWNASIKNSGSSHFTSRHTATAYTLFGTQVAQTTTDFLILPGTTRTTSEVMPRPHFPGIYRFSYGVGLGDTPNAQIDRYVLYMPPFAWILLVLIALISAFLAISRQLRTPK